MIRSGKRRPSSMSFLASVETIRRPGATKSGLTTPSCVVPYEENQAGWSSPAAAVPPSSGAPTTRVYGWLAGGSRVVSVPPLPAAATTTMPLNHAYSTAASSRLVLYDSGTVEISDRFRTRMLYLSLFSTTHSMPSTASEMWETPFLFETLTEIRSTPGATPGYLSRLLSLSSQSPQPPPPTIPATQVP